MGHGFVLVRPAVHSEEWTVRGLLHDAIHKDLHEAAIIAKENGVADGVEWNTATGLFI